MILKTFALYRLEVYPCDIGGYTKMATPASSPHPRGDLEVFFGKLKALFAAIVKYHMLSDEEAPNRIDILTAIGEEWSTVQADPTFAHLVKIPNKDLKATPLVLPGDGNSYEVKSFEDAIESLSYRPTVCHRDRSRIAEQAIMKLWKFAGNDQSVLTQILVQAQKQKGK